MERPWCPLDRMGMSQTYIYSYNYSLWSPLLEHYAVGDNTFWNMWKTAVYKASVSTYNKIQLKVEETVKNKWVKDELTSSKQCSRIINSNQWCLPNTVPHTGRPAMDRQLDAFLLRVTWKRLEFPPHTHVVIGSNLCLETGYTDKSLSLSSSLPPCKFQDNTLKQATTTTFHILSNSFFINYPLIRCTKLQATLPSHLPISYHKQYKIYKNT